MLDSGSVGFCAPHAARSNRSFFKGSNECSMVTRMNLAAETWEGVGVGCTSRA